MNKFQQHIALTLLLSFGVSNINAAPEEIPGTGLAVDFAESVLSGAGRLIRATNIPVESAGTTVYYDVEMDFTRLSDGSFGAKLISATPSTGAASPTSVSTMNFLPGTYAGIAPGSADSALPCFFNLDAPSIGADGRRTYLLTVTSNGTGCPEGITSYTWQTGPAFKNNIIGSVGASELNSFVKASSLTYAYGLDSDNTYLRVLQIENTLTLQEVSASGSTSSRKIFTLKKQ
ncbi:hypothetical protein [Nitrosomonas sp. wSCUT-2]